MSPWQGAFNEYPQHMFLRRNKKIINICVLMKFALEKKASYLNVC